LHPLALFPTLKRWDKEAAEQGQFAVKYSKICPLGAKAKPLFCCICGTTEVVPFQNLCRRQSFPQPVKTAAGPTQLNLEPAWRTSPVYAIASPSPHLRRSG
jgi:hypothetical protein